MLNKKLLNNVETAIVATGLDKELEKFKLVSDDMIYFADLYVYLGFGILPLMLDTICNYGIPKSVFNSDHDFTAELLDKILKISDEDLARFCLVYSNTVSSSYEEQRGEKYPFCGMPLAQWNEIVMTIRHAWESIRQ